jgi:hypothetical protein
MAIGRDEAKALGLKRFFTGKPCKHGHVAERGLSTPDAWSAVPWWRRIRETTVDNRNVTGAPPSAYQRQRDRFRVNLTKAAGL